MDMFHRNLLGEIFTYYYQRVSVQRDSIELWVKLGDGQHGQQCLTLLVMLIHRCTKALEQSGSNLMSVANEQRLAKPVNKP